MRRRPSVIIVGGGFGGLSAAQALKSAPVDVTLIDRNNYHLFQPLLYQVATGSLSAGEIAAPLRSVLSCQKNTRVLLGTVLDIDPLSKHGRFCNSLQPPTWRDDRNDPATATPVNGCKMH
jgi:NADH dehydrogenase FAD-containing subunit